MTVSMRDKDNIIFHIDVNSAFLSWEASRRIKENPNAMDIRTIPSAIGGDEKARHGIVLAKSVPAKHFGIMTGEPLASARKKCPDLMVIPPDFSLYVECSNQFIEYLKEIAPEVDQYSIDEAFCDMTGTSALYGDFIALAHEMKDEIAKRFGFTVNIGISTNRLLAKMASDFEKPNKVHTLFPEEIPEKMWPLPVGSLFSVGRSTKSKLAALGFHTIGDVAKCDRSILMNHFKKHGDVLWNYANGYDIGGVQKNSESVKSIGNSLTLPYDVTDKNTANMILLSLCETVGARIRAEKVYAGSVSVGIKDCDFNQQSKQCLLSSPTNITEELYHHALSLFEELWDGRPLRLLGLSASHITDTPFRQINLFHPTQNERLSKLNSAVDKIRQKYGEDSIKRARFIDNEYNHMTSGLNKEKRNASYDDE